MAPIAPDRQAAEDATLAALRSGDYEAAARTVKEFEARQPVPRGMGIDWATHDTRGDVFALTMIFEHVPGILTGVRPDGLEKLREAAGMMALWGVPRPRRTWLPLHYESGVWLDGDVAARMLLFAAYHARDLDSYAGIVMRVKILPCPDCCDECATIAGKIFPIDACPELPYPACTSDMGCCCTASGDL